MNINLHIHNLNINEKEEEPKEIVDFYKNIWSANKGFIQGTLDYWVTNFSKTKEEEKIKKEILDVLCIIMKHMTDLENRSKV